jgi:hypothetical protein
LSNQELAEHVDFALHCFADTILKLERQQQQLAERIAFIAPTESDIRREVESFIRNSLAA